MAHSSTGIASECHWLCQCRCDSIVRKSSVGKQRTLLQNKNGRISHRGRMAAHQLSAVPETVDVEVQNSSTWLKTRHTRPLVCTIRVGRDSRGCSRLMPGRLHSRKCSCRSPLPLARTGSKTFPVVPERSVSEPEVIHLRPDFL